MEPGHRFVDDDGREYDLYDFITGADFRRRRVPFNDRKAEARAFVPLDGGPVLIATFGPTGYHCVERKLVLDQLRFAKPLRASAAERMDSRVTRR
jgi:hypothetical protein